MSRFERVALSLSPGERDALRELARRRGEPEATAAARMVRAGLADLGARLDDPPQRRRGPSLASGDPLPKPVAWLPTSKRARAVAALIERYPGDLRAALLPADGDRGGAERLAALSVWRDQLDTGQFPDPRVEVAFGDELVRTGRWLEDRSRRRR